MTYPCASPPGNGSVAGEAAIMLDLPAEFRYLDILGACVAATLGHLDDLPDAETVVYNVQLAVQEICVNIVDHAYGGAPGRRIQAKVSLNAEPRAITIELDDQGIEFDPGTVGAPNLDDPQVRGYGLFLAHQLMDEVSYTRLAGANRWRLTKRL